MTNEEKQLWKMKHNAETIRKNEKNLEKIFTKERAKDHINSLVYNNGRNGGKAGSR